MGKGELGVGPMKDELKSIGSYTVRNLLKFLFLIEYGEDS
jgi:hypothetical protein